MFLRKSYLINKQSPPPHYSGKPVPTTKESFGAKASTNEGSPEFIPRLPLFTSIAVTSPSRTTIAQSYLYIYSIVTTILLNSICNLSQITLQRYE